MRGQAPRSAADASRVREALYMAALNAVQPRRSLQGLLRKAATGRKTGKARPHGPRQKAHDHRQHHHARQESLHPSSTIITVAGSRSRATACLTKSQRRSLGRDTRAVLLASLFICVLLSVAASAQSFPTRPIRLIVPFPPAGITDLSARLVAEGLRLKFNQPVMSRTSPAPMASSACARYSRPSPTAIR